MDRLDEIEQLPTVSHRDIDIERLAPILRDWFENVCETSLQEFTNTPRLKEIYIVGSFAEGTAKKLASDLDIRYVVEYITTTQKETLHSYFHDKSQPQLPEDVPFGYVDPQVKTYPPECTSVKIDSDYF